MKICYFYAHHFEAAEKALPDDASRIYTGDHPWQYWESLAREWDSREALITVEQDIILTPEILAEFSRCDYPWCTFRYASGPTHEWPLLDHALGCTKFSAQAQSRVSVEDILQVSCWLRIHCSRYPRSNGVTCSPGALCWIHIDGPIAQAMSEHGISPHIHETIVDHIHDW